MTMPGRIYSSSSSKYRYGFNGKELDKDITNEAYDYGARIYDTRTGRLLSTDPLTSKFAFYSPYQYAGNKPIWCIDLLGLQSLPTTELNQYGEKQVYEIHVFGKPKLWARGGGGTVYPNEHYETKTPVGTPVTQNLTDVQVYQMAFYRYANPGNSLIKAEQYIDERMMKAEAQVSYFFSNNVPAYSKSQAASSTAHAAIAVSLMAGDPTAVSQIQKSDDFLYRHAIAPFATPIVAAGTSALLNISEEGLSITIGMRNNAGQSLSTAEKTGAPYYSKWAEMGIYNPSEFKGWGDAFKYVTNQVLNSGGKIHFELAGLNIPEALAGDAGTWVGRYTAWELQQVTSNVQLFKATEFYLNGVKQSASELAKIGIKSP